MYLPEQFEENRTEVLIDFIHKFIESSNFVFNKLLNLNGKSN